MLKKLKQRLPELAEAGVPMASVPIFRQLVTYIDSSITDSYAKEGDERAKQLLSHLISLRDFMSRQITENGLRQVLVNEMLTIIDELEKEEAVELADDNSEEIDLEEDSTKKNDQDISLTETS